MKSRGRGSNGGEIVNVRLRVVTQLGLVRRYQISVGKYCLFSPEDRECIFLQNIVSSALKTEAVFFSKVSVSISDCTRRHNPEELVI
jgi:hypothetical protein